jgi:isopentenyl-diphosphate delta-isomerase
MEQVILVNEKDEQTGVMEKMEAHRQALLHRAFSVFVFDSEGKLLLQQRAYSKYHSGGLWTNTCCSHPQPGEKVKDAALRRLQEELGFTTPLTKVFDFVYRSDFDNGLTEHEFDHVFIGNYNGRINPDPAEVAAIKYVELNDIEEDLKANPDSYTTWFRIAFPKLLHWMRE